MYWMAPDVGEMVPVRMPDWGTLEAFKAKVGQGAAYPVGMEEGFVQEVWAETLNPRVEAPNMAEMSSRRYLDIWEQRTD